MFVNILVQIATLDNESIKIVFSVVVLAATHNLAEGLFHDAFGTLLNVVVVALVAVSMCVGLGGGSGGRCCLVVVSSRSSCLCLGAGLSCSLCCDLLSSSLLGSGLC